MSTMIPFCYTIESDESMDRSFSFQSSHEFHSSMFDSMNSKRVCAICGSKAIGMNFGASTCAPCKAFFRRNARRKEVLSFPCQHRQIISPDGSMIDESIRYLQIRRCSSCRLQRCFQIGMKEELVRTEEENLRHRQLVDFNRKRRQTMKEQQEENLLLIPSDIQTANEILNETDWRHLANVVQAYDIHCLKTFIQQRSTVEFDQSSRTLMRDDSLVKSYISLPINYVLSLSSFLRSLPAFQTLPHSHRAYLCKTNIRPLIIPNSYELTQCCFSDPTQAEQERNSWALMCGEGLFQRFLITRQLAQSKLIADPIVTRLWLIILFFSSSLFTYYDPNQYNKSKIKKSFSSSTIENGYVTLLWKYLLHRHGPDQSVRIFSNLIHVFLQMIRVGIDINVRLRTQSEHVTTHETLSQLVSLDINHI